MGNVTRGDEVVGEAASRGCPSAVQEALGELAGAAKEGLLALSVGVGLGVLHEMMEAEVDEVVCPWADDPVDLGFHDLVQHAQADADA